MKSRVSIVTCDTYDPASVLAATRRALDLLGGMSAFVTRKSKVLVKPNLLMAIEPARAVDTHPEVVRAVIRLLKELDCTVYLGDGPSVWAGQAGNIERVYEVSGIKRVADEEKVNLVTFSKRRWRTSFPLTAWLDECDYFVSIPKFKTHELTMLTGAIKNLYGLVSDSYKTELHRRYFGIREFSRRVVDILAEAAPNLSVIDGIDCIEGDGPATGGTVRHCGLLLAGKDAVSLDSILAVIMGIAPRDVVTTREAAARGLGNADINSIEVLGETLSGVCGKPFVLPKAALSQKLPRGMVDIVLNLLRSYPVINQPRCTRCGACAYACPAKVITVGERTVIRYRGCISCFCCQETCPEAAISVKKSLLARMARL
jgi:uncharacterized protein (DUF362 family)/NAD-dependent dihydropyrimidine dehydrogenase PreA subunit